MFFVIGTGLIISSLYAYIKLVYIASFSVAEKYCSRYGYSLTRFLIDCLSKLKLYFILYLIFIIVHVLLFISSTNSLVIRSLISLSAFLGGLTLEYLVSPYLLLRKILSVRHIRLSTLIMYFTIPWFILALLISIMVNAPIYYTFGSLAIYPYFHPWSKDVVELVQKGAPIIWTPTYGDLLGVIIIAFYSKWIVLEKI